MAWLARDHRFAAGRYARVGTEKTDRGSVHEKSLGDRHDDDRRRYLADDRRARGKTRSRDGPAQGQRRTRGRVCAGTRADSGFQSIGIDDHGRFVRRTDTRDSGAVLVSAVDSGGCREWVAGAEGSDREAAGRELRVAGGGDGGFRGRGLCVDLVPAALSQDAFDRYFYCVSCDYWGSDFSGAGARLYVGKYLKNISHAAAQRRHENAAPLRLCVRKTIYATLDSGTLRLPLLINLKTKRAVIL